MTTQDSIIEIRKREILAEVDFWYEKGLKLFPQPAKTIDVVFDLSGKVAGRAHTNRYSGPHTLQFNIGLAVENRDNFLHTTVPHEVAHLIANIFFQDIRPEGCHHDELWGFVMKKLGIAPDVYHSMIITDSSEELSRIAKKLPAEFV